MGVGAPTPCAVASNAAAAASAMSSGFIWPSSRGAWRVMDRAVVRKSRDYDRATAAVARFIRCLGHVARLLPARSREDAIAWLTRRYRELTFRGRPTMAQAAAAGDR